MAVKGEYQPRVSGNAENGFYTLVIRYDSNGFGGLEEVVQHGYKGRHFKTREAGIKSAQKWIDKQMGGRATNPATEKLDPSIDYLFAHATKAENLIAGDEILDPMNKKFNRVVTQVDALASGLKVFARYPDGEVRTTHYNYGDIVRTKWDASTVHAAKKRKRVMTVLNRKSRKTNPVSGDNMHTKIRTIDIVGVEWFQKTYGNSYHAVRVSVNGEHVYTSPMTYGYGEQYIYTALGALRELGYPIPPNRELVPRAWARENGIELDAYIREVKTQKALKEFAAPATMAKRKTNPRGGGEVDGHAVEENYRDEVYQQMRAITRRANPSATNRTTKKTVYMVVIVKPNSTKPHGYWTGANWDTEKKVAKHYANRTGERGAEKVAQKLAKAVKGSDYLVAIYTDKVAPSKK